MAVQQASFYCPTCQQQRLFTSQGGVNHVFYLLLTLFSCGLWAIVWLIQNVSYVPRFHCSQCGYSDAVKYLANPYLRSQEAQQRAERGALQAESSGSWFSRLTTQTKIFIFVGLLLFIVIDVAVFSAIENAKRESNTKANANTTANNSSNTTTSPPQNVFRDPSGLSPAENLEEAKRRLSTGEDVDKTFASMHLEAIPKTAKEYSAAKQLLAEITVYFKRVNQRANQRNEPSNRKDIEDELARLAGEDAQLDKALDLYEDYDGPAATATKLNALKRKTQIELRRIELERKLKRMK